MNLYEDALRSTKSKSDPDRSQSKDKSTFEQTHPTEVNASNPSTVVVGSNQQSEESADINKLNVPTSNLFSVLEKEEQEAGGGGGAAKQESTQSEWDKEITFQRESRTEKNTKIQSEPSKEPFFGGTKMETSSGMHKKQKSDQQSGMQMPSSFRGEQFPALPQGTGQSTPEVEHLKMPPVHLEFYTHQHDDTIGQHGSLDSYLDLHTKLQNKMPAQSIESQSSATPLTDAKPIEPAPLKIPLSAQTKQERKQQHHSNNNKQQWRPQQRQQQGQQQQGPAAARYSAHKKSLGQAQHSAFPSDAQPKHRRDDIKQQQSGTINDEKQWED